eukprot:TRINITY_DN1539_c0_g1_i15.p1 TRINITY_DN1539_c0_g1~~TRINITY_DN1539_c0_g1_i15.p1  ORF type:complete len:340 (+),score=70.76 TRINITY_DN1539_c0_g1_i15:72-1091(+)
MCIRDRCKRSAISIHENRFIIAMDFNFLVFPSPKPSYTHSSFYGSVLYIPTDPYLWETTPPLVPFNQTFLLADKESACAVHGAYEASCIPCLFVPAKIPSNKILLHFHGNSEDAGGSKSLATTLRNYLNVNVLIVEYKGYGIYKGSPSASSILDDADLVFTYLICALRFKPEDILIFGRSIGSGPACYLSSKYSIHSLILMSAFTTLREVVKGIVGPLLKYMVADRFNNAEWLKTAKCPVFLVHGDMDKFVNAKHALELYKAVKGKRKLHIAETMTHDKLNAIADFITPLMTFYKEIGYEVVSNVRGYDASSDPTKKTTSKKESLYYFPIKAFNKPVSP